MDLLSLLAQATSEPTNADAWSRTLTLLFGGSGVVTLISGAGAYVWKKNADRRFEAEQENRRILQELQMDATLAQRELVEHLKAEIQVGRKISRTNTRAVQALKRSSEKSVVVLQQIADNQATVREDLSKVMDDPSRQCGYKKETPSLQEA